MRFVNRNEELQFLNEEYDKDCSSLVIIYGRRRVGKTSLIREFIKDKASIYFLATEESEKVNRNLFREEVAEYLGSDLLKSAKLDRWEPIFETLISDKGRKLVVIDEFQYIGKSDASFPSVIQKIWDNILEKENIMLILCGSLISMMVDQTLSYSSPLYGRRTGQIKLGQVDFVHFSEFFEEKSFKKLIELYSISGGVPKYIELLDCKRDIRNLIEDIFFSKSNFLYEEPYFLLSKEVSEIGSYFSILRAIAAGNHKMARISSFLEVKQVSLTRYLKVLMDLDILYRDVPVTEKHPEKSKKGLYRFKDNYLKFWFKFIYPNKSQIEKGRYAEVLNKIMLNFVDGHVAFVYEDVARESLYKLNFIKDNAIFIDALGRWWSKDNEIDIVALDENNKIILFGECKYWKGKVGMSVLLDLQKRSKSVDWNIENRMEYYVLYSLNGFSEDLIAYASKSKYIVLVEGLHQIT
ncbi:ATP-binding protein [Acidaminobacter sp. JC074]|uniref:AAA family ATPase n=1 Tax=Acidaminobacter sp. JC074 TaxID=2530199 RepID=UPI001F0FD30C|nr:ATP-binding protein [Acidaminobacter sp. JC074]MCH4890205.1 ATP-binding protein [Acidaminobacter sp. JC074]